MRNSDRRKTKQGLSFVARGLTAERFAVDVAADGEAGLELATPMPTISLFST